MTIQIPDGTAERVTLKLEDGTEYDAYYTTIPAVVTLNKPKKGEKVHALKAGGKVIECKVTAEHYQDFNRIMWRVKDGEGNKTSDFLRVSGFVSSIEQAAPKRSEEALKAIEIERLNAENEDLKRKLAALNG